MAVYHLSMSKIQRSAGRSAVAAAAYRASEMYTDERTGEHHDYTRKRGVENSEIFAPKDAPEWAHNRGRLWNEAEAAETRKNSVTAREIVLGLPHELPANERRELANEFARHLVERYKVAVDVNIHAPSKDGDGRNHHAHLLFSTRQILADGFGSKTRELDDKKSGPAELEHLRAEWELYANRALSGAGQTSRIDHRTLTEQGEDRLPTRHMGPTATAMERRGVRTERGRWNRKVAALHNARKRATRLEHEGRAAKAHGPDLMQSALNQAQNGVQRDFQKGARAVEDLLKSRKPTEQQSTPGQAVEGRRHEAGGAGGNPPSIAPEGRGAAVSQGEALPSRRGVFFTPKTVQSLDALSPREVQKRFEAREIRADREARREAFLAKQPGWKDWFEGREAYSRERQEFSRDRATDRMLKAAREREWAHLAQERAEFEERLRNASPLERAKFKIGVGTLAKEEAALAERGAEFELQERPLEKRQAADMTRRVAQMVKLAKQEAAARRKLGLDGKTKAEFDRGLAEHRAKVGAEWGREREAWGHYFTDRNAQEGAKRAAQKQQQAQQKRQESPLERVKRLTVEAENYPTRGERDKARAQVKTLSGQLSRADQYQLKKWREAQECGRER
ncbi:MobA/MobL family protein [Desulfovibrio sp. UIB00]|uniref:MobQ family relaxase n=1 Tax=Desulfovibrio sp. UIB00 TaxID=2804314 RepID=UPI001FDC5EC4|nr:MobQ family relaxase [Desulfovibrio sp. UIB00]MCH5146358.1 MobA/MobL family protein [Desulfovibrio sp. UIB00]